MYKTRNILVFTEWAFEEGLIQSYTLPYLRIIHKINPDIKIFLITREKSGLEKNREKLEEISNQLKKDNIILIAEKYNRANLKKYFETGVQFLKHIKLILSNNIGYIHTFCTPAGGYGYLLAKTTGRKLVIDSYEPHSEYMLDSGVWGGQSFPYKVLKWLEKKQAQRADYLIATTPTMVPYTEKRFNIKLKESYVKPACVNLDKFSYSEIQAKKIKQELQIENKIVGMYAGKFGDFYLKEEIFELLKVCFEYWGNKFHFLLLSDLPPEELELYSKKYGIAWESITLVKAPHHMVPVYMSAADFGISPYKPAVSKKFCTPIKNGEYWALGLPVIITKNISVDSDMIEDLNIGYVLQSLNRNGYVNAAKKIDELLNGDRDFLRKKIRKVAEQKRSYTIAQNIYEKIYK